MNKIFISADELLNDAFILANQIFESDFCPNFIIGVWRGGTPVAAAVHEYFAYKGVQTDHIAIRASSYQGIDQQQAVTLYGMDYVFENLTLNSRVLVVDDVFDTGKSMNAIIEAIRQQQPNLPSNALKTATPWYKPKRNSTNITPDYYLHTSEQWLVFPHELCGLTRDEITNNKAFLPDLDKSMLSRP